MQVVNYLRLQADTDTVKSILSQIANVQDGIGSLDFNAVTPMPTWMQTCPEAERRAWCRQNWQIESNAEAVPGYDGGDTICFLTDNADVCDLVQKLSCAFPDVYIDYLWAAEDIEKSPGAMQFLDGAYTVQYRPKAGTKQAYLMALDILHAQPEEYGLIFDEAADNFCVKGGIALGSRHD